jgi:hypothetical protein
MASRINIEEAPARVVGRRRAPAAAFSPADTRREARAWASAFRTPFVPRGVHRFSTHEEADAWMWAMISRPRRLS